MRTERPLTKVPSTHNTSQPTTLTPVGAVVRGLLAGAVGTAAMDRFLYVRYRHGGGTSGPEEWEFSEDLSGWEDAPAPAQVGNVSGKPCSRSTFRPPARGLSTT